MTASLQNTLSLNELIDALERLRSEHGGGLPVSIYVPGAGGPLGPGGVDTPLAAALDPADVVWAETQTVCVRLVERTGG